MKTKLSKINFVLENTLDIKYSKNCILVTICSVRFEIMILLKISNENKFLSQ